MRLIVLALFLALVACSDDGSSSFNEDDYVSEDLEPVGEGVSFNADSTYFLKKFGTSHIKIAFRNELDGSLVLVERSGKEGSVKVFDVDVDAYHPQFSPDGSKLAYGTNFEGSPGTSDVYVLDLTQEDATPVKLDVPAAGVPRWRVLENGDTAIVFVDMLSSVDSPEWLESSTWVVTFENGKFGKPEKILAGSYNGGVAMDNSFGVTGAPRLLLHKAEDEAGVDSHLYGGDQVCNVSLARDSSNVFSFLETRGKMGQEYTDDEHYLWHEYLFFMNTDGKLVKAIKSLPGSVFEFTEWINYPGYEVAVVNPDETWYMLALIDVENSSVDIILTVDEEKYQIMHPDFWVD